MCCAACSVVPPAMESSWASMNPSCIRSARLLSDENEGHYPELRERQAYITKVIRVEEENFTQDH